MMEEEKWAGCKLYYYEETDSTMDDAKRLAESGAVHGTVVVADKQNAGKGRRGRVWQSPAGKDLYFTLLLKPDFAPDRAAGLTLVMALAVTQAIEKNCGIKAEIKWPNDVVVNGKKVCGILTEMGVAGGKIQQVTIGAGVNVNRTDSPEDIPEEIKETATSLFLQTGKVVDREELLQEILRAFEIDYEKYVQTLNMEQLLEEYNLRLVNRDRRVRVLDPKGAFEGVAKGINASGELLVETAEGTILEVYAGEVSVRGLYGYV